MAILTVVWTDILFISVLFRFHFFTWYPYDLGHLLRGFGTLLHTWHSLYVSVCTIDSLLGSGNIPYLRMFSVQQVLWVVWFLFSYSLLLWEYWGTWAQHVPNTFRVCVVRSKIKTKFRPKFRLKNAKELGETSLMFLVHPSLTIDEIDRACTAIKKVSIMATKVASS